MASSNYNAGITYNYLRRIIHDSPHMIEQSLLLIAGHYLYVPNVGYNTNKTQVMAEITSEEVTFDPAGNCLEFWYDIVIHVYA